jgi:hypothetical protein
MPCRKVKDLIFPAAGMGTGMDFWIISNKVITTTIPATYNPRRVRENALGAVEGPGDLRDYIKRKTERCI